jgi:hypothetical protein
MIVVGMLGGFVFLLPLGHDINVAALSLATAFHPDAGRFQRRHILFGAAACGFHDLDAALPDRGNVLGIGWRRRTSGR